MSAGVMTAMLPGMGSVMSDRGAAAWRAGSSRHTGSRRPQKAMLKTRACI